MPFAATLRNLFKPGPVSLEPSAYSNEVVRTKKIKRNVFFLEGIASAAMMGYTLKIRSDRLSGVLDRRIRRNAAISIVLYVAISAILLRVLWVNRLSKRPTIPVPTPQQSVPPVLMTPNKGKVSSAPSTPRGSHEPFAPDLRSPPRTEMAAADPLVTFNAADSSVTPLPRTPADKGVTSNTTRTPSPMRNRIPEALDSGSRLPAIPKGALSLKRPLLNDFGMDLPGLDLTDQYRRFKAEDYVASPAPATDSATSSAAPTPDSAVSSASQTPDTSASSGAFPSPARTVPDGWTSGGAGRPHRLNISIHGNSEGTNSGADPI